MIVFKEKDVSYVAIPMKIHEYLNKGLTDYESDDNWDAFYTDDKEPTIIAVDSEFNRATDIMRYSGIFNNLNMNNEDLHAVNNRMKVIFDGTNININEYKYDIMVLRKDKIFEVRSYGTVLEVYDFDTFGESRQFGYGIYENVKHIKNVEDRVREYYEIHSKTSFGDPFPIVLLNTKNKIPVIIERK